MALGMEKAGIEHLLLKDFDRYATDTLKLNRPKWNVIHGDIAKIDFKPYKGIDILTGGFPCQVFSYAGKKRCMEDTRGILFYEFARSIKKESEPKVFLAENVKALKSHDGGRTLATKVEVFKSMGYDTLEQGNIESSVFQEVSEISPNVLQSLYLLSFRKYEGFHNFNV